MFVALEQYCSSLASSGAMLNQLIEWSTVSGTFDYRLTLRDKHFGVISKTKTVVAVHLHNGKSRVKLVGFKVHKNILTLKTPLS